MSKEQHTIAGAHVVGSLPTRTTAATFTVLLEQRGAHACRAPAFPSYAWFDPLLDRFAQRAAAMIALAPEGVEVGAHLPAPIERDHSACFAPLVNLSNDYEQLRLGRAQHEGGRGRGSAAGTPGPLRPHAEVAQPLPTHR